MHVEFALRSATSAEVPPMNIIGAKNLSSTEADGRMTANMVTQKVD